MGRAVTRSDKTVIGVVIPCFREKDHILDVVAGIGPEVSHIVIVDDACPDRTGAFVEAACDDERVQVVVHETNQGVGGATLTGYRRAIECGADVIVKLDGDGQMDPAMIPQLVKPIVEQWADYAKGNRFHDLDGVAGMPTLRVVGNLALSFATKLSSGYWNVFDPTNGYTAIHARVASHLPFEKIAKGFFFESDMLFRLYLLGAVVADMPMRAHYGNEQSKLRISRILGTFVARHCVNAFKRVFYTYFLRDFTAASVELIVGGALLLFGTVFGLLNWRESVVTGIPATTGTVMLAALPIIVGTQMLIAFLDFDTRNIPREPIQLRL